MWHFSLGMTLITVYPRRPGTVSPVNVMIDKKRKVYRFDKATGDHEWYYQDCNSFKDIAVYNIPSGIRFMWNGDNFLSYGAQGEDVVHHLPTDDSQVIKVILPSIGGGSTVVYADVESSRYVHIVSWHGITGTFTLADGSAAATTALSAEPTAEVTAAAATMEAAAAATAAAATAAVDTAAVSEKKAPNKKRKARNAK